MRKQLFVTDSTYPDGSENGGLSSMQFNVDSHLVYNSSTNAGNLYGGMTVTLIMRVKWKETHFDDSDPNASGGWDLMAYGETTASSSVQCGVDNNKKPSVTVWDNDGDQRITYGDPGNATYPDGRLSFDVHGDGWCRYAVPLTHYGGGSLGITTADLLFPIYMSTSTTTFPGTFYGTGETINWISSDPVSAFGNLSPRYGPFATPEIWIGCGFGGVGHTGGVPSGTTAASLRIYDIMLVDNDLRNLELYYGVPDDPSIDARILDQNGNPLLGGRAAEVVHWWRPGYDRDNIGKDYVGTANLTEVNLDASDIRVDAP